MAYICYVDASTWGVFAALPHEVSQETKEFVYDEFGKEVYYMSRLKVDSLEMAKALLACNKSSKTYTYPDVKGLITL